MLSYEKYTLVKDKYWVADFKSERLSDNFKNLSWSWWVFSPYRKPRQMVNGNMHWRRPTYEDAIIRQSAYDIDPENFFKVCSESSFNNGKYT